MKQVKLNAKKTKVLHMSQKETNTIRKHGKFQIFGSIKSSCTNNIKVRIGMAKTRIMIGLNNVLKDHSISLGLKIKLMKCGK